jgi:hypothetical protein
MEAGLGLSAAAAYASGAFVESRDVNSGLFGPIIGTRNGCARPARPSLRT